MFARTSRAASSLFQRRCYGLAPALAGRAQGTQWVQRAGAFAAVGGLGAAAYLAQPKEKFSSCSLFGGSKKGNFKVCVCGGSGGIGQPLSLLMSMDPNVSELSVYDLTIAMVPPAGVAADLNHIEKGVKVKGYAKSLEEKAIDKLGDCLKDCSLVLVPAGMPRKPGQTRDDLFKVNANIAKEVVEACAKYCPNAVVALIVNPVNSVVPAMAELYKKKGLDPKKIVGITTLDCVRANKFVSEITGEDPDNVEVPVIGGHAGVTIMPVFSQDKTAAKIPASEIPALDKHVQDAGTRPADEAAGEKPHEREMELAELEGRIREFSRQLLQPTIRKVTLLEHEQQELALEANRTATIIGELARTATKVDQQVASVDAFQLELSRWDNERRHAQGETTADLAGMRQDLGHLRYEIERQDTTINSVQRTIDRLVGELSKVQECSDELRKYAQRRLESQNKQLNSKTMELEVKLVALETRHNLLSDDLWGEETGLAKVTRSLNETRDTVLSHSNELNKMQKDKAGLAQLEAVQLEVNVLKHEANNHIFGLRDTVNTMVANVKSHFDTATSTVAAHNAEMLSDARKQYTEELRQAEQTRAEIVQFMQDGEKKLAALEHSVKWCQDSTEEMVQKVSGDVDEMTKNLRRDRNTDEVRTLSMQEQLNTVSNTSATVATNLEHLTSVLWMMVQCERAASAMDQQDAADRAKVALMGYRDGPPPTGPGRHASPGSTARGSGPRQKKKSGTSGDGPVMSVDHRCLSCSGQAQTVLSGFKMACLQYTPGPVQFARKSFDRGDLLDLRDKLLVQMHEAMEHGPIRFSPKDPFGAREAAPRVGVASETASTRGEGLESRSSMASTSAPPTHSLPPLSARSAPSR